VAGTYLVYLYKRGTFYPFVPLPVAEKRDSDRERLLKVTLAQDLSMEPDLERWFPLWGSQSTDGAPWPGGWALAPGGSPRLTAHVG